MSDDVNEKRLTHDERGKFAVGNRVNPGGRHKSIKATLVLLRDPDQMTLGVERLKQLRDQNERPEVALAATKLWFELAGVPKAPIVVEGEDGNPIDIAVGLYAAIKRLAEPE